MKKKIILIVLFIGVIYKLALTWDGNFLFHMDSARDMVDVREMVILRKPRLTGPSTAIDGLFNGPAWYYFLAVPFIISGGNPYASIVMQIIMWVVGGIFLLKIVSRWSILLMLPIGFLWIASDYVGLSTVYVFNPNPVTLLTPLFIFLLYKYMETNKLIFAISTFFLGGLFFNFEMNFGVFIPIIIFFSILFSKKTFIFKDRKFWIGLCFFLLWLLPQIIFDIKHQFIMFNGLIAHLHRESGNFNFIKNFQNTVNSFYNVLEPTMLNKKFLSFMVLILFVPVLFKFFNHQKKDAAVIIALLFIFIPFTGYLFLPVTLNPWHLGAEMVAAIILVGFLLRQLSDTNLLGKLIAFGLSLPIIIFSLTNIMSYFISDMGKPNMDPSLFKNEIAAIDFVYKYTDGKNFKVYTYLPSIYDYPYQYLFWWYGLKEYDFLPIDYAYAPDKPEYISNKESFSATEDNLKKRENSNLVFLIKEPDHKFTSFGWEGEFVKLETVEKQMIGPIEIDIRKEINQQ